jgi:hypothetical protein
MAINPGFWLVRERLPRKRGEVGRAQWGPLLPAAIMLMHTRAEPGETGNRMERSPFFAAFVGDEPVSIYELQQDNDHDIARIFQTERVIDEAEYNFRLADLRWAREHAPDEPQANPHTAINLMTAPLPF